MAKYFFTGGKKLASVLFALTASALLVTSCSTDTANDLSHDNKDDKVPGLQGPVNTDIAPGIIDPGPVAAAPIWDTVQLMVRTDPADPHNERFLDDWRFQAFTIDDQARQTSPIYWGETGPDGNALLGLPSYMFALPLVIAAYNDVLPLDCEVHEDEDEEPDPEPQFVALQDNGNGDNGHDHDHDDLDCHCRLFEIFIPPFCHDKAVWLLGPLEGSLWHFYRKAAERRAEAWNPSQVDCGTWLANLQLLILTDEVADELNELSDSDDMIFHDDALIHAFQENQHLLTPTRPPICMAERRHNGGGMERGDILEDQDDADPDTFILDDFVDPFTTEVLPDDDPIVIDTADGIVQDICGLTIADDGVLSVNEVQFGSEENFLLDDEDFMGTVHDLVGDSIDVSIYNVRLGNGFELDHDKFDDACALTSIIQFTNKDDDEQDIFTDTGVTFTDLFEGDDAEVYLTSDGDAVVGDNDFWAIFASGDDRCEESVIAVELLGHRQEDFRDVLHMTFDDATDELFLGLRADYELNEEEVDGERAFLAYTIHVWDGSSTEGRHAIRDNIANCYEASDIWARQFFKTVDFDELEDECCFDEDCDIKDLICPKKAAEFAVRSQCFSNSRANQRWRTDDSGYWSMNTEHGVHGNVIVNPGWLAPDLDFEVYIQKFDEAVFKGPRTIRRTDKVGQLMVELPTLVEGDRVLIKSEDNCCDDYDLVIPCVPEFTGFAGAPGIPYVPVTLGPPPPPGILPVGPGVPPVAPGVPVAEAPAEPTAELAAEEAPSR